LFAILSTTFVNGGVNPVKMAEEAGGGGPAVDLGGRVWLGGKPCKGGPAAPRLRRLTALIGFSPSSPLRKPDGFSITLSPFRRPTPETMPVDAKAGCLYPNNARSLFEARSRGFDDALVCDVVGNVAELATSNIFMVRDGVVFTPVPNGTFLAGITRQRIIGLLRDAGLAVVEKTLKYPDFEAADEIFSTGNFSKVVPVTRIDQRSLQPVPTFRKARELYWDFAHGS